MIHKYQDENFAQVVNVDPNLFSGLNPQKPSPQPVCKQLRIHLLSFLQDVLYF